MSPVSLTYKILQDRQIQHRYIALCFLRFPQLYVYFCVHVSSCGGSYFHHLRMQNDFNTTRIPISCLHLFSAICVWRPEDNTGIFLRSSHWGWSSLFQLDGCPAQASRILGLPSAETAGPHYHMQPFLWTPGIQMQVLIHSKHISRGPSRRPFFFLPNFCFLHPAPP